MPQVIFHTNDYSRVRRHSITMTLVAWLGFTAANPLSAAVFTDATKESGIEFVMTCGRSPSGAILEVNGGGVAFVDHDNDGDWDLFFANGATMDNVENGPGSRLYANDGAGRFKDVSASLAIRVKRWAMGVAVGDVDADGCDDIFISCFGPNILLRNECSGSDGPKFVDVGSQAGIADKRWATSAAFGDIDRDNDLDLYIVNYLEFDPNKPPDSTGMVFMGVPVMAGPAGLVPQADVLLRNDGKGRFTDITTSAGAVPENHGYGLVTAMFDVDRDGHQDIFVGNDSNMNFLFHNKGDGTFEEIGLYSGIACNFDGATQATMGIAIADVNANSFPDAFTTNFSSDTNTLHLNLGNRFFDDRTSQFGLAMISRPFLSWGCGFYDFNGDGEEDLFISCGHVYPQAGSKKLDSEYLQPPLYFERNGKRFERKTDAGDVLNKAYAGRAAAFGDIDNDGDVDVVMTTLNGPVLVLENESTAGTPVVVVLEGPGGNRRGLGSVIELTDGENIQRRWIHGGSYQSVNAPAAYFFLDEDSKPASMQLKVTWPDGSSVKHDDIRPGHKHIVGGKSGIRYKKLRPRR
ncbi:MAG: CRTAC1 family protein [Planctomycetota bacterium]|jgi:hypothetical protein